MKLKTTLFFIYQILLSTTIFAQTPGLIYKPSSTSFGKSVLDPNSDGYVSINTTGFSTIDYGTESELPMISIPLLIGEPSGDLSTGGSGGHTEIVGFNGGNSVFVLKKNVGGTDYLIVRFRIGKASTASKGYSLLIDTDNSFGNTSSSNPGFEKEIILETNNAVKIYTHNVAAGTITNNLTYALNEYHQRSVALSTNNGDADYFYDFFVPYNDIGISSNVRFAATTITSAQSGILGTKSDINGINDQQYGGNPFTAFSTIINSFPPTDFNNLISGGSFLPLITTAPVITSTINTASVSIAGSSLEPNGTLIEVFKNGVSIGTTTVSSFTWTLSGVSGLAAGNQITAKATAMGKMVSPASANIEVTAVQTCFIYSPVITSRTNGSQVVSGTWSSGGLTISPNTVRIRLYSLDANNLTETEITSAVNQFVNTDGTWSFTTNVSQSTFNGLTVYARAEFSGCVSGLSNGSGKTSGGSTVITVTPSLVTNPINANTGSQTIQVRNNHSTAANLYIYVNNIRLATILIGVAANTTVNYSITGLIKNDVVHVRALDVTSANHYLSNASNLVSVGSVAGQTIAPNISGSYIASNTVVNGTSTEAAGTVIYVYKNGSTLLGTATVNIYGNWTLSGLSLNAGDVLTAKAESYGKTLSNSSGSVTVAASAPTAPTLSGPIQAGATTISGTGGIGTVEIYVDGSLLGTTTGASWSFTGYNSNEIYKGAVITAKNLQNGILSSSSNAVTVTGVNSFKVTDTSNNQIPTQTAGTAFNIKVSAVDGLSGGGSVVTTFAGQVVTSSNSAIILGGGQTANFLSGILASHSLNLTSAGVNKTITVVSTTDPTAVGTALVTVVAGAPTKFNIIASSTTIGTNQNITVSAQLSDAYNNPISTSGITVNWSATNGGSFSSSSSLTDSNGLATITFTTSGSTTSQVITASATSPAVSGESETITVDETLSTTEFNALAFKVYPNPITNNRITIELQEIIDENMVIEMYSVMGQQVFKLNKYFGTYKKVIELPESIGKGIYFLKVKSGIKSATKKIVLN